MQQSYTSIKPLITEIKLFHATNESKWKQIILHNKILCEQKSINKVRGKTTNSMYTKISLLFVCFFSDRKFWRKSRKSHFHKTGIFLCKGVRWTSIPIQFAARLCIDWLGRVLWLSANMNDFMCIIAHQHVRQIPCFNLVKSVRKMNTSSNNNTKPMRSTSKVECKVVPYTYWNLIDIVYVIIVTKKLSSYTANNI